VTIDRLILLFSHMKVHYQPIYGHAFINIFLLLIPEYSSCILLVYTILMRVFRCTPSHRRNGLPIICKH